MQDVSRVDVGTDGWQVVHYQHRWSFGNAYPFSVLPSSHGFEIRAAAFCFVDLDICVVNLLS